MTYFTESERLGRRMYLLEWYNPDRAYCAICGATEDGHCEHNWLLREDSGETNILEMPLRYCKEMLCNWKGAGRAIGKPDTKGWYLKNKDKMLLGHETRQWIEQQLSIESV